MKIAIIDDEEYISNNIKVYLERKDTYNIKTYTDPNYALSNVISGYYDVILLDINMPLMDGIEFLEKLKEQNKNQKVIMMTAQSTEEKMIKCDQLGVCDYITKPFISLRDIENKILDIMEKA